MKCRCQFGLRKSAKKSLQRAAYPLQGGIAIVNLAAKCEEMAMSAALVVRRSARWQGKRLAEARLLVSGNKAERSCHGVFTPSMPEKSRSSEKR